MKRYCVAVRHFPGKFFLSWENGTSGEKKFTGIWRAKREIWNSEGATDQRLKFRRRKEDGKERKLMIDPIGLTDGLSLSAISVFLSLVFTRYLDGPR